MNASLPSASESGRASPDEPDSAGHLTQDPESGIEAFYRLESWAVCPHCREKIEAVGVVRLLRSHVNFTSTLPRKGQLTVCASCRSVLPAQLGGFV